MCNEEGYVFNSNSIIDSTNGEGRCDLLPLEVISNCFNDDVIFYISLFLKDNDSDLFNCILKDFLINNNISWCDAVLIASKHIGEYKEQPLPILVDSLVKHYLKYINGDKDEDHLSEFLWYIFACMYVSRNLSR